MSSPSLERFLARLYTDRAFLEHFLNAPSEAMADSGLTAHEQRCVAAMDRGRLLLAAHSYQAKRTARGWHRGRWRRLWERLSPWTWRPPGR